MAQLMEYAEYLSKEIGPRPAGTEEEQQAALYITECFQKDSGFTSQIEEFTTASNVEGLSAIPGIVVIVAAILGMIFPMLTIPAFILAAAAAALYTLEAFGRPVVTRALARGASQNVVAKYQPNAQVEQTARGRSRKIVLVAHYDSGKVTPGIVRAIESVKLPVPIGLVCVGGIVAAAFFLLLHIFVNAGVPGIIVNVLTVIALIVCVYPVLRAILFRIAPYNEGANNNAAGTAAIIEVARRISRGSVSEADLAGDPEAFGITVHGEAAARESGLVPEGAQIRYEAEQLVPPSELGEYDEEERLLSAKAAIAALTGKPVERRTYGTVATHLVNSRAHGDDPNVGVLSEAPAAEGPEAGQPAYAADLQPAAAPVEAPAQEAKPAGAVQFAEDAPVAAELTPAPEPEPEPAQAEGFSNAPSWFISAQQNAKKPAGETGPIQRSRYAEAIEAAEREAAEREREAAERERLQREAELKERELAARAAIEQNAQAARPAQPQSAEEAQQAPEQGSEPAEQATPVFVPYAEAPVVAAAPVEGAPADDEFAASLGDTTAFDPHQLQAYEEASAAKAKAADEAQAALDRLAALPTFDAPAPDAAGQAAALDAGVPETTSPSRSGMFRKLRTDVPSMSGVIRMQEAGQDVSQLPARPEPHVPRVDSAPQPGVSQPAPASAQHEPALQGDAPDAVDYDMNYAELRDIAGEGAVADGRDGYDAYDDREPLEIPEAYADYADEYLDDGGQVDMPKSRAGGFFGRFRRKKDEGLAETPQEWLDVDDDFDARTVGRERGGWESFREDAYEDYENETPHSRRWEGGAYSRVRLGRVDTRSGEGAEADTPSEIIEYEDDRQIADEIEQIYHFRNPLYNTEIWFVALGSDGPMHDGAKAFVAEHADELRGSMIIEVESLGLGELAAASAEGRVRRQTASSRVKRYMRAATTATGIAPGSVDLTGADSATTVFQSAGYQAMHLLGVEDGKQALKGSADDILENIDDLLLDDNVNFLMELLKK